MVIDDGRALRAEAETKTRLVSYQWESGIRKLKELKIKQMLIWPHEKNIDCYVSVYGNMDVEAGLWITVYAYRKAIDFEQRLLKMSHKLKNTKVHIKLWQKRAAVSRSIARQKMAY